MNPSHAPSQQRARALKRAAVASLSDPDHYRRQGRAALGPNATIRTARAVLVRQIGIAKQSGDYPAARKAQAQLDALNAALAATAKPQERSA